MNIKTTGTKVLIFVLLLIVGSTPALSEDSPWPKVLKGAKGSIEIYEPQIESFSGNKLESRSAVSVTEGKDSAPVFGAMWFSCDLSIDKNDNTATLEKVIVTESRFPTMDAGKVDKISRYIEQDVPKWDLVISLDHLRASLEGSSGDARNPDNLKSTPPQLHYRTHPAVLVLVDGDPILKDMQGFELEYVLNSAFFIIKDKKTKAFFLRGSGMWFTSDGLGGKWTLTTNLSEEVSKISAKIEQDEKDQAKASDDDATELEIEKNTDEAPPEIIISTVPAELIITEGTADFATIEGTQLLYLRNTEDDVVMDISSQQYFVLIAGRWYGTKSLSDGPWKSVAFEDLPEDFAKIPSDSDMGRVLASVGGTRESREAILDAQIPQTAEVDRKTATCSVTYDGDPQFKACGDDISYALNTDSSVLLIENQYYCVDNAVWFVAAGPTGPWQVATNVPAVIQDLPADCPVYNVKYVQIYSSTPEVVYVGYTPGYYGSYVYGPCVVYGTGWRYDPWYGMYYYPRPVTYGYGVCYSPGGSWGFTFGMSYGWLHIGAGWGRPYYGPWGPGGYRYGYRQGYWRGYNHGYNRGYNRGYRHGASAGYRAGNKAGQRQPNNNAYRKRKDGVRRTGNQGKDPRLTPSPSNRKNNVYTDNKGNVYRDKDGQWDKREDGKWKSDKSTDRDRPAPSDKSKDRSKEQVKPRDNKQPRDRQQHDRQQLNRDRSSRQQGESRPQRSSPQPQRSGRRR